jgi:hypothetical protein
MRQTSTQWAIFCGGEVLDAVQRASLFDDSKTFVYALPSLP